MDESDQALVELKKQIKERDVQFDLLNAFINQDPSLSSDAVIVQGYKAVGKSLVVTKFLEALNIKYSRINCDECISKKILLQKCFSRFRKDSGIRHGKYSKNDYLRYGSIGENFSNLLSAVEQFMDERNYNQHHVLVLDRFDQCMESTRDLFGSFLRFREQSRIKSLTVIIIISGEVPKDVASLSIPHVYFDEYSESQIVGILQDNQLAKFGIDEIDDTPSSADFWAKYAKVIVDLFFEYTGSDLNLLKEICIRLWDRFIEPIKEGRLMVSDFIKIYKESIDLFTDDNIITNSSIRDFSTLEEEKQIDNGNVADLPLHSKFFLLASYLASYGNPRGDLQKFSKVKLVKYKRRALTSPAKIKKAHMLKTDIDNRLLSPNYVDLERILAILAVIYRNYAPSLNQSDKDELLYIDDEIVAREEKKELEKSKFTLTKNTDLNNQIATLYSLGLLSKTSSSDILGAKIRWKCNINWPTAESLAKMVNFPIAEYLIED
ncbi:uncharacterized protein J8A68_004887 [[Candida] subhashii]|uniref:Orc1-like AAA ATPase domain-containing protein n=1 Tax=[Candida] subhashii TaxID=561895 RepID=A0A8J5QGJ1_9ASCO|nr:uncharacterized protein J8A68_004887 [[Candida] subhashii]KAG7661618.1 hypothetical protein J8A68_004887 [[Candida] subhashii]